MPDVSVIVPMRNAERWIGAALGSVLSGPGPAVEVIVVDDGSSDDGPGIVERFASADPRVRLLRNRGRRGPAGGRNTGLDAARGDWIALLDADDTYEPGRLDRLLDVARRVDADLVADNLRLVASRGRDAPRIAFPWPQDGLPRPFTLRDFLDEEFGDLWRRRGHLPPAYMQPFVRRAFIERNRLRYDERLLQFEDCKLYFDLLAHGARAWRIGDPLYNYRVGHPSTSCRPNTRAVSDAVAVLSESAPGSAPRAPSDGPDQHRFLIGGMKRRRAHIGAQEAVLLLKERRVGAAAALLWRNPERWPWCAAIVLTAASKRVRSCLGRIRRGRAGPDGTIGAGDVLRRVENLPFADLDHIIGDGIPLVLAPHPDDESLGCGGLIAEACARGRPPVVVVLTDGTMSHPTSPSYPPRRLRALREEETRTAVAALGLGPDRVIFLGLPDTQAPREGVAAAEIAARVAHIAREHGASAILATWGQDPHEDHVAADAIAQEAARLAGVRRVSYPVWAWTLPRHQRLPDAPVAGFRLDIARHLPAKRRAIAAHASQHSGLITDDPAGFRLPDALLSVFDRPFEVFLFGAARQSAPVAPPSGLLQLRVPTQPADLVEAGEGAAAGGEGEVDVCPGVRSARSGAGSD